MSWISLNPLRIVISREWGVGELGCGGCGGGNWGVGCVGGCVGVCVCGGGGGRGGGVGWELCVCVWGGGDCVCVCVCGGGGGGGGGGSEPMQGPSRELTNDDTFLSDTTTEKCTFEKIFAKCQSSLWYLAR